MNTGLWNMDSGLAAVPRPGMTWWDWFARTAGGDQKSMQRPPISQSP